MPGFIPNQLLRLSLFFFHGALARFRAMVFQLTFLQPSLFLSAAFQIRTWNISTSSLQTACSHLSLGRVSLALGPPCCNKRPAATFVICVYYKIRYTTYCHFFNVRQAKQPAITGVALSHKNITRPRSRLSHGPTSSKISSRFFFGDTHPSLLSCQPNEFCSGVESATSSNNFADILNVYISPHPLGLRRHQQIAAVSHPNTLLSYQPADVQ